MREGNMSQLINQIEALGFKRKGICKPEHLNTLVNKFEKSPVASSLFNKYIFDILSNISGVYEDKTYSTESDKLKFYINDKWFFLAIPQKNGCKITISLRAEILSIYPQFESMMTKSYSTIKLNDKRDRNDNFTLELGSVDAKQAMSDFACVLGVISEEPTIENTKPEGRTMSTVNDIENTPLNQILYGPPGTGKTYHTIEAAVKAAEPTFTFTDRTQLKAEYNRLVAENRIRFVTFHQSYGYEEFVEGLRANSKDGDISYDVDPGVFKSICTEAKDSKYQKEFELKPNAKVWKISIDGTGQSKIRQKCFEEHFAAIGWGATGDLLNETPSDDEKTYYESLGPLAKSTLYELSEGAQEGDLVLCIGSKREIQAVGVVSGDYQYLESGVLHKDYYCHALPINWLATDININFYELNGNKDFTQKTFYHLWRFNASDVFELLKKHDVKLQMSPEQDASSDNYVLIIDEINRGNISKVFGELITLIEPSKRSGEDQEEALELTLPYSGTKFSVPNNLYIIGTMNTADRSLAMMDTALRRRFDFVEMMPNAELFNGKSVKGIDLQKLLETMNKRIEVLYDREHTLGHAFFIPVKSLVDDNKEDAAFIELKSVFKNKIIPLLEEYFFEDWNKIRLVLGDNRKAESLRFVTEEKQSYDEIFGAGHGLDSYETESTSYTLASFDGEESVWGKAAAYIGIYPSKPVEVNKSDSESEAA